jgi:hypothetical protein
MLNSNSNPETCDMAYQRSFDRPCRYQIRLDAVLDEKWACWFDGFTFAYAQDETILTGQVVDQAALYGLLAKICDLGAPLISVIRL